MSDKCEYCDGIGEIEMDNNGPIAPCPICQQEVDIDRDTIHQALLEQEELNNEG